MAVPRSLARPLADSTFLRVYVLLALALVLTFALALAGFAMIDQVRREHYREQLAEAPMALLVNQLAEQPAALRESWLEQRSEALDISLRLYERDSLPLNYFQRSRLEAGRVLIQPEGKLGWRLQRLLPGEPRVLEAVLMSLNERQLRGLAEGLGQWLERGDAGQREERLKVLESAAFSVQLSNEPPSGLDAGQRERLGDGEVIIRMLPERWALSLYLQLSRDGEPTQWVHIGPVEAFEPMPLSLSLLMLVVMLLVLAGTIYLIVRGVEARMARLELAATRIAGGHLDTRVKVESGDFLGRLGMAFNGMAAQVQSLLRAQQEMIRAVSHELRTPVARIRFAVQMVEDMTDEEPVRRQLSGIDSDIEELDGLIDEILTYARLGGDHGHGMVLETEMVDCRAMAARVVEALAPLHGHLELSIVPGDDVEVMAEPRYLQRALQNLVANACRHAESRVQIRLHGESRAIRLDVEDDGPGVPETDRMEIFKPFARLDNSRTRRSGGYGLGLSIVHKIMAWHGGSVMVDDSEALGGARFSLLLPVQPHSHSLIPH
ncbi:two-component sensor histidine kinase [Litchfieldella qijiaojingensis]|uniref:histidine kinase n=1 Tax=Litchfieldella qijiaojingensis TaxID=980347 RepID=A0ABQ2YTX3_9GAMM|nr:ATP-binding protein [Halomonas qijiaojingensis]GGX94511.1 two-component sensor histidine kinase [Halomonas qijiaojingensis]